MTAAEVIEQIMALPPAEREIVIDFIKNMDAEEIEPGTSADRFSHELATKALFRKDREALRRLAE